MLVVEDAVVSSLRDGASAVLPGLHVEEVSWNVGETVLVLVREGSSRKRIVGRGASQSRVGVVRQVVVRAGSVVLEAKEQRLHGVGEVELGALLADSSLGAVVLLELLDGDIDGLILMGSALIVRHEDVLGPLVDVGQLEGLAVGHGQDVGEVDASSSLVDPVRGIVDNIGGGVLLHADEVGQVGLHDERLLDIVQRRAAQRQSVARVTSVVERKRQLDDSGWQIRAELLQSSRVADELLVQRPLVSSHAVLRQEIEHHVVVRLDGQIVEHESSLLPDVVGQIPGEGHAPCELAVVRRVDGQGGRLRRDPGHQGEVSGLGELEDGLGHGTRVGVRREQLSVPRELLDLTREEGGHGIAPVPELIDQII